MVIDVFSKYSWIKTLKDKKTETVIKAFDKIFKTSKRKPKMLWSDKGYEFISKHFKEFLKKNKIKLNSPGVCQFWKKRKQWLRHQP